MTGSCTPFAKRNALHFHAKKKRQRDILSWVVILPGSELWNLLFYRNRTQFLLVSSLYKTMFLLPEPSYSMTWGRTCFSSALNFQGMGLPLLCTCLQSQLAELGRSRWHDLHTPLEQWYWESICSCKMCIYLKFTALSSEVVNVCSASSSATEFLSLLTSVTPFPRGGEHGSPLEKCFNTRAKALSQLTFYYDFGNQEESS